MQFVMKEDGTVVPFKDHVESETWEGGEHKNEKKAEMPALTAAERSELISFRKSHSKEIGTGDRGELFVRQAAKELVRLREENDSRRKEGKDPIAKADRELSLSGGVVKSTWRKKEEAKAQQEARISTVAELTGRDY